MQCTYHYKDKSSACTWCSQPVCEECIKEAENHKLCPSCKVKLQKTDSLTKKRTKGTKNVDPTLSEEGVRRAKILLEEKQGKRKIKIRNIPDWPQLK